MIRSRKCANYMRNFIAAASKEYDFFEPVFDKNKSGKNFTFKLK